MTVPVQDIATPVDPGFGPARAYVGRSAGGWQAEWAREGRRAEPVGPVFPKVRDAIALSRELNARGADA